MPELEPPEPPPRHIEREPSPLPVMEPSLVEGALSTVPPKTPTRPIVKPEPEPPKPEPPRVEPERPVSVAPPLTLKPAGASAQTEASIRALLDRAQKNLQLVKDTALNADRLAQFDIARRFMLQAEEALKSNNLAFAGKLADKAANMAAILVR
jgi:hypothetical protein